MPIQAQSKRAHSTFLSLPQTPFFKETHVHFLCSVLATPLCLQLKYRSSIQSILMGFFQQVARRLVVSTRGYINSCKFRVGQAWSQKSYSSQPNKHFCKVHLPAVKTRLTDNNQTLPGTGTRLQSLIKKNSGLLFQFTSMSEDSSISCSLRSDSDSLGKNDGSLTRPLNDRSEGLPVFFSQSVTCSSLSHENGLSSPTSQVALGPPFFLLVLT